MFRRSRTLNSLDTPASHTCIVGPRMDPLPAVPKKPGVGAANAPALNQWLTPRWSSWRFGLMPVAFGRMVTLAGVALPVNAVFAGSVPVHAGDRYRPER